MARLSQLEAENERLKAQKAKAMTLKVSEKGALSVYGLGRFPISLYRSQWEGLLGAKDDILAFIEENTARLATKD